MFDHQHLAHYRLSTAHVTSLYTRRDRTNGKVLVVARLRRGGGDGDSRRSTVIALGPDRHLRLPFVALLGSILVDLETV
ncbi:hypothetical protein DsansV1_C18g0151651 [Dioscorea sansibarensis]